MPPHAGAAQILRQTLAWLKQDRAMQADRAAPQQGLLQPGEVCNPAKRTPSRHRRTAHPKAR